MTATIEKLYNKQLNSYAIWNGDAWNDENVSGAYFYSIEKANNNGYYAVRELTESQKNFILDNFFKHEDYAGWKNIATALIENGTCVTPNTQSGFSIWRKKNIGTFIDVETADEFIDCVRYKFDLDKFLSSDWFKHVRKSYVNEEQIKIDAMIKINEELNNL